MKRGLVLLLIALIFISIFSLVFVVSQSGPVVNDTQEKQFTVSQGDGIISIATRLENNKLVNNRYIFLYYAYRLGLYSKLQAGTFKISPSLSSVEVALKLSKTGTQDYWLKIIDGQRIEEITPLFPATYEGYLFPDSYLIPQKYTNSQILEVIDSHFKSKFAEAKQNATNTKMSDSEIITLASILEREGRTLDTKQKIAGILLNRLNIGMALQIDATVQYARDSRPPAPKTYWLPVSKKDLSIDSTFNTYKYPGLPPSPICNPGYNSIYAAFHPIASDYLYYITDNNGNIHFSETLDEHNANISKYLR